ncbi:hypothetical protein MCOR10_010667 [Pyricularia oryzae]|nr:hypothetical protein MCOR10_010667 [Pyricularia oryzae]
MPRPAAWPAIPHKGSIGDSSFQDLEQTIRFDTHRTFGAKIPPYGHLRQVWHPVFDNLVIQLSEESGKSILYANGLSLADYGQSCIWKSARMQLDSTCVNRLQRIVEQGSDFLSHSPSLIHDAIRGINTVSLEDAIISEHGKTNDLDIYGNSPLHWAAVLGDTAAARTLLRHGSKQDIRSRNGNSPLLEACSWCDLKMATVLIDAGADVKITNSIGQTALHHAARSENPHLVRLLLGKGALPNAADKWGQMPLHCIITLHYGQERTRSFSPPHEVWDPTIDWYFLEEDVDERQDPWGREPWVEDDGDGGCFLGLLALFGEDCDDMEDLEAATSHASDEDDEAFFDAVDF